MEKLTTCIKDDKITIQRADYIEDGWYVEIVGEEINLYEMPQFGGEPYLIERCKTILEAIRKGEALT